MSFWPMLTQTSGTDTQLDSMPNLDVEAWPCQQVMNITVVIVVITIVSSASHRRQRRRRSSSSIVKMEYANAAIW